jgi:hypothetical protein
MSGVHTASWVQLMNYGRKRNGSGLENWESGRRDPLRWLRGTLYPQKLALTSPTSGCCSVGIVRSRTLPLSIFLVERQCTLLIQILNISTNVLIRISSIRLITTGENSFVHLPNSFPIKSVFYSIILNTTALTFLQNNRNACYKILRYLSASPIT